MARKGDYSSLEKRLKAIPKAVRDAVRPALQKSGEELTAAIRNITPVRTGKLRESVDWNFGDPKPGARLKVAGGAPGEDLRVSVSAGGEGAFYAPFVEFGTKAGTKRGRTPDATRPGKTRKVYRTHPGTQAQPFFYGTFRLMRKRLSRRIKTAIGKAVRTEWKE